MSHTLTGRPGICVSLHDGLPPGMAARRSAVCSLADLVEVRIDLLRDPGRLEEMVAGWPLPVVACCRRERDGGRFHGGEDERLRMLQRAAAAGAALVDLEGDALMLFRQPGWPDETRFIFSMHDPEGPFSRPLAEIYRELAAPGPAMVKLVPTALTLEDGFGFLEQLKALTARLGPGDPPLCAFCMGESGIFTRILAFAHGASMVYASTSRHTSVAAGQLPADELTGIYRCRDVHPETCFTGILGSRVAGSLSPLIHNHLYRRLELDRCYLPLSAGPGELPRFLKRFAAGDLPIDLSGLSVTTPFKTTVMPFADQLAPCACHAGAVNTLLRRPGGLLRGYNTDVHGIRETLRGSQGDDLEGRRALVIGAGGAARAAALALTTLGMEVAVANRTVHRARELALEWGGDGGGLDAFVGERFDLVINTTAAAPAGSETDLPSFQLEDSGTIIFDLNYHPPLTPLLAAGRRLGCPILDGLQMLASQGERQFRLFTGRRPPPNAMLEILRAVGGGVS